MASKYSQLVDEFLLMKAFLLHLLDLGVFVRLLVLNLRKPILALSHLSAERTLTCLRFLQSLLKRLNLFILAVDLLIQCVDLFLEPTLDVLKGKL